MKVTRRDAPEGPPRGEQSKGLTWLQALRLLYAIMQSRYVQGYSLAGYFSRFGTDQWDDYLNRGIRRMALEQAANPLCVVCSEPRAKNTVGDHLIPLSKGGPDSAENYLALCQPCNSSKGAKDLLEWWHYRGYAISDLPTDPLCMYARLRYRMACQVEELDQPTSDIIVALLRAAILEFDQRDRQAILKSTGIT